ncbi:MAG: CHAD domain-containing protein, partial [Caldilineaceae bacterium]|nr:CHAD domain-containing protein [Caldilineaceae bacterium]
RHVVPSLLMTRFASVRRYEILFAASATVPYETIHELRIDCKYLRYSLEFVEELLGAEGKALIQHLKELQDLLGDLNDAVVAMGRLQSKEAEAASSYIQQQQAVIDQLTNEIPHVFADFIAHHTRQELALAIARL